MARSLGVPINSVFGALETCLGSTLRESSRSSTRASRCGCRLMRIIGASYPTSPTLTVANEFRRHGAARSTRPKYETSSGQSFSHAIIFIRPFRSLVPARSRA